MPGKSFQTNKYLITIIFILPFFAIIYLLNNNFNSAFSLSMQPKEKLQLLDRRINEFYAYGMLLYLTLMIVVNIAAIKQKQLSWLFIPLLFAIVAGFIYSSGLEKIFVFKKQNGLWDGGFSLSFIAGIFFSSVAGIILFFNWLVLRSYSKQ